MDAKDLTNAKQELSAANLGSSKVEALIEAMILAATADGQLTTEEIGQLADVIHTLTDRSFAREAVIELVRQTAELLRAQGRTARLATLAVRLPGTRIREAAVLLAATVAAADGDIDLSENNLLADLGEAMGLDGTRMVELVTAVRRPT